MAEYGTNVAGSEGKDNYAPKEASEKIRVMIHIPENVRENIRQQKINRIYDILNP